MGARVDEASNSNPTNASFRCCLVKLLKVFMILRNNK